MNQKLLRKALPLAEVNDWKLFESWKLKMNDSLQAEPDWSLTELVDSTAGSTGDGSEMKWSSVVNPQAGDIGSCGSFS
jgi:hypothetical protein